MTTLIAVWVYEDGAGVNGVQEEGGNAILISYSLCFGLCVPFGLQNMYKNNLQEYKKKVRAIARKSVEG